jgi:hypothetical protein
VGAIGGILGVYLGFSFLAIYEFVEILIRSGYLLCFLPRPKSPEVGSQEQPVIYTSQSSLAEAGSGDITVKTMENGRKSGSARRLSAARLYDHLYQMQHQVQ